MKKYRNNLTTSDRKNGKYQILKRIFLIFYTSCLLFQLIVIAKSNAQPAICIPRANGVPANPGPPIWWDVNDNDVLDFPSEDDRLDDPRWRGAVGVDLTGYGTGATEQVVFRALHRSGNLYLSWHVRVVPRFDDENLDTLYVGLSMGELEDELGVIIKVTPHTASSSLPKMAQGFVDVETLVSTNNGMTWSSWEETGGGGPATPKWVSDSTKVWFIEKPSSPGNYEWAIQMLVPINPAASSNLDNSGINLPNPFKMWFELRVVTPPEIAGGDGQVIVYNYPDMVSTTSTPPIYPRPFMTWGDFCIENCPAASLLTCAEGVSITSSQIGTTNPMPHRILLNDPNTFFAAPTNNTGGDIDAGNITARFRLANWGSLPNWNDIPDPSLLWRDIPAPGGSTASNSGDIIDGADADIQLMPWELSVCERFDYLPDPYPLECGDPLPPERFKKRIHQCMLVELSGAAGLKFTPNSVYRNMDFVNASRFSREAEISVLGLGADALNRPKRDVYLYVETINLPRNLGSDRVPTNPDFKVGPSVRDINVPGVRDRPGIVSTQQLSIDELALQRPTYVVHVYHDTGRRLRFGGADHPVLRPQSSFGYFVSHDGEIEGWEHSLAGARLIAPNFYKIEIPNDGVAVISTTIEAIEPKPLALSIHFGIDLPHGDISDFYDPGFAGTIDIALRLSRSMYLEGLLGLYQFKGKNQFSDLSVTQLAGNLKFVFPIYRRAHLFMNGGGGAYHFKAGSTKMGFNIGSGIQFNLSSSVALEAAYNYHNVPDTEPSFRFSTFQGIIRSRF